MSKSETNAILLELEARITRAREDLLAFDPKGEAVRPNALAFLLHFSVDVATGVNATAKVGLPESTGVLTRSLLEVAVLSLHVVQSEENAGEYLRSGDYTLERLHKAHEGGFHIPGTNLDELRKAAIQGTGRRANYSDMAKDMEIGSWFMGWYAFFSSIAHGTAVLTRQGKNDRTILAIVHASNILFGSIQSTYREWIYEGNITDPATLAYDLRLSDGK